MKETDGHTQEETNYGNRWRSLMVPYEQRQIHRTNIRHTGTCNICKYIYIYSHLNRVHTNPLCSAFWVPKQHMYKHTYTYTGKTIHSKSALTPSTQCLWNKQNLAEKEASRHDPNNHQNKVCQLSGTVQRRSMGNWTGYEKCVFLLSTAHFDVPYQLEMNGK